MREGKSPFWQARTPEGLEERRGTARQAERELERDRLAERAKTIRPDLARQIDESVRRRVEGMR